MKRVYHFSLLLFFLAYLLIGCKEKWDPFEKPVPPEDKEYDINDDQIIDFKIKYQLWTWDGLNSSGDMYSCEVVPVNNARLLVHNDSGLLPCQVNDTIFHQVITPFRWASTYYDIPFLLSIISDSRTGWQREWTTKNNVKRDFYYISFKMPAADKEYLGWIKLKINNLTGEIEITDRQLNSSDYLIIGR